MSLAEFGQRWKALAVPTASVMMIASAGVGCVFAAFLYELLDLSDTQMPVFYFTFSIWGAPSVFMIGQWMGRRSSLTNETNRDPFWAYLMGLAVPAFLLIASSLVNGLDELVLVGVFLVVFLILAPYGYHVGRKQVRGAYVEYLINRLPSAEQDAIVDFAYRRSQGAL